MSTSYITHQFSIELDGMLPVISYVQCELIEAVATSRLDRLVGSLDDIHLAQARLVLARLLGLTTAAR